MSLMLAISLEMSSVNMLTTPILSSQLLMLTRTREIENIRSWSCAKNLNLNLKKSSEIVFVDSMRRRQIQLP